MTVAQRLYGMIALAILGLVGLTGLGQMQMGKIYETANYGTINTVPSLLVLGDALVNFQNIRTVSFRHVLSTDDAKMAEWDSVISGKKAGIEKALKDYEPLLSNDEDARLLAFDRDLLQDYYAGLEQALALSRKNQNEQAQALLQNGEESALKVEKAFTEHFFFNKNLCDEGSKVAVATKDSATTLSIVITLAVLILITAIGVWVVRKLASQLGGEPGLVADLANRIAAGDLSTAIPLNAGDNVSVMAAMKNMTDTLKDLLADTGVLIKAAAISIPASTPINIKAIFASWCKASTIRSPTSPSR